jgi:hypothetical protein
VLLAQVLKLGTGDKKIVRAVPDLSKREAILKR